MVGRFHITPIEPSQSDHMNTGRATKKRETDDGMSLDWTGQFGRFIYVEGGPHLDTYLRQVCYGERLHVPNHLPELDRN